MSQNEIVSRIKIVREMITRSCEVIKRDPNDITIVAVSKKQSVEAIQRAYHDGMIHFGENYIQELISKVSEINTSGNYHNIQWHFIGHLQTNKIKYIQPNWMIQTVHSHDLAIALNKRAESFQKKISILLQIKLDHEVHRNGISAEQLPELIEKCQALPFIQIKGLMTILPKTVSDSANENLIFKNYQNVHEIFLKIREKYFQTDQFNILSMGMSDDYHLAIKAGANMIRVGTAIFGERHYGA